MDKSKKHYESVYISLDLPIGVNKRLSEAAFRSGRSKIVEAIVRLQDHLAHFTYISETIQRDSKSTRITLKLSPDLNKNLTEAAIKSGEYRNVEAMIRLANHLENFPDIATPGRRFRKDGSSG